MGVGYSNSCKEKSAGALDGNTSYTATLTCMYGVFMVYGVWAWVSWLRHRAGEKWQSASLLKDEYLTICRNGLGLENSFSFPAQNPASACGSLPYPVYYPSNIYLH